LVQKFPAGHILFTNGEYDPFQQISVLPGNNFNPRVETLLIKKGEHHFDLYYPADDTTIEHYGRDDPEVRENVMAARQKFLSLARVWISE
jgi:hypothetical protein